MRKLEGLLPEDVFYYFEDICSIPHGSGNTGQISSYCAEFARARGLRYRQEDCGNIIIFKDASPGYEDAPTVILQGHMDMVAVKEADCDKDMEREGLDIKVDGDWISAEGTSLGGDDGIALACAMAILADEEAVHPALEAVFTVDEETGLLGAASLDTGDLKGSILMNIDSEDDGIFLTGCAGGATARITLPFEKERPAKDLYELRISGLKGGHSGTEIILERANANVLLGRLLSVISARVRICAGNISGGEKDNAIARLAGAYISADPDARGELEAAFKAEKEAIVSEFSYTDPEISITLEKKPEGSACENVIFLTAADTAGLGRLISLLPAGVQRRTPQMPDMVQTSLNMGIITQSEDHIEITLSVRSSLESEKSWLLARMKDLSESLGAEMEVFGIYPAWEYREDSLIRSIMTDTYRRITGKEAQCRSIHAGVECGIFCGKMPGLDCISYGPQMYDIHTTGERLSISSVKRNYELTRMALEKIR